MLQGGEVSKTPMHGVTHFMDVPYDVAPLPDMWPINELTSDIGGYKLYNTLLLFTLVNSAMSGPEKCQSAGFIFIGLSLIYSYLILPLNDFIRVCVDTALLSINMS